MTTAREIALASVRREAAEYEAIEALCTESLPRRRRDRPGATSTSAVLSVRLTYDTLEALERRAALTAIAPSSLARNLIRLGLAPRNPVAAELIDELQTLTARLRATIP